MKEIEKKFKNVEIKKLINDDVYLIVFNNSKKLIYRYSDDNRSPYFQKYEVLTRDLYQLYYQDGYCSFLSIKEMLASPKIKFSYYKPRTIRGKLFHFCTYKETRRLIRLDHMGLSDEIMPVSVFSGSTQCFDHKREVSDDSNESKDTIVCLSDNHFSQYFCVESLRTSPWFTEEERINDDVSFLYYKTGGIRSSVATYLFNFLSFKSLAIDYDYLEILGGKYLLLHKNSELILLRLSDFDLYVFSGSPDKIFYQEDHNTVFCKSGSEIFQLTKHMEFICYNSEKRVSI